MSGLSLLAAVLNNFVERGADCPHIFVATHMHRVMNMLPQTPIIEEQVRYIHFQRHLFERLKRFP